MKVKSNPSSNQPICKGKDCTHIVQSASKADFERGIEGRWGKEGDHDGWEVVKVKETAKVKEKMVE